MTKKQTASRLHLAAWLAGLGYLAIFLLAIFANFLVIESLLVPGDAAATMANVSSSPGLLRGGIVAFLLVFAIDVLIAWGLYILFRSVDDSLSLLTAWFRLLYTVFLGIAVIPLGLVLGASASGDAAQVLSLFSAFNLAWLTGLLLFGLHLIVLGVLVVRSGFVPRLLGYLLMLAGFVYIIDTLLQFAFVNYQAYASLFLAMVAIPSIVGEFWMTLWLLFRGTRLEEQEDS